MLVRSHTKNAVWNLDHRGTIGMPSCLDVEGIAVGWIGTHSGNSILIVSQSGDGRVQAAVTKMSSVALRLRCCDGLLDLGLQVANVEAGSGLHRRILDEARNMLCYDLPRNLETPHLVLERVVIANRPALEPLLRPVHPFEGVLAQVG